ncbi:MAG: NFACT RNA binding domain-containing protein [Spirochaetota bacterium]
MSNDNRIRIKRYRTASGLPILAGQSDISNDELTFRVAKQNDLWFHIHGFPGSHVVLVCGEGEPSKADIEEAAGIAVYHSKMRDGGAVDVSYCFARDVHKPAGAKDGSVNIKNEKRVKVKALVLTPEE